MVAGPCKVAGAAQDYQEEEKIVRCETDSTKRVKPVTLVQLVTSKPSDVGT